MAAVPVPLVARVLRERLRPTCRDDVRGELDVGRLDVGVGEAELAPIPRMIRMAPVSMDPGIATAVARAGP
jgi:hypothetical protein